MERKINNRQNVDLFNQHELEAIKVNICLDYISIEKLKNDITVQRFNYEINKIWLILIMIP